MKLQQKDEGADQNKQEIATGRIEDRKNKKRMCEGEIKRRREYDKNMVIKGESKPARGWAKKTDIKRENGWVKEGEQLCRSKWLGLIRHETLHTGAKKADRTCYVSQLASQKKRQTPNWTAT